jgi:hypothetical protein
LRLRNVSPWQDGKEDAPRTLGAMNAHRAALRFGQASRQRKA